MSIVFRITRAGPVVNPGRVLSSLFVAGLLIVLGACASGPDKRFAHDAHLQAKTAYLAQDYPRALAIVEPQAAAGEAWAQYTLGYMYYYGHGVRIDRLLARQWIEQAAAQNYPPAKEALNRVASAPRAAADEAPVTPALVPAPALQAASPPLSPEPQPEPQPQLQSPHQAEPAPPVPVASPLQQAPPAPPPVPETPHQAESAPSPHAASPQTSALDQQNHSWIRAQDPQRLTVQLIGGSDRQAITGYMADNALGEQATYYVSERAGAPWYVVIYGSYGDLAEARSALTRLPPDLRQASPWIRSFAEIQKQLAAGQ